MSITVRVSPSLALIKYWGKSDPTQNLPATSSLAITLQELHTETSVTYSNSDIVSIDGLVAPADRYARFFDNLREKLHVSYFFEAKSSSNFPIAAGLASSSSGFAALAYACTHLASKEADIQLISQLARVGSASAARALFGGFTVLEKGAEYAKVLFDNHHWPELRVVVATVKGDAKKISSRNAMVRAQQTSPLFASWIREAEEIFQEGLEAVKNRDLPKLGPLMRRSYLMMFSTMFTSSPPLIYWEPDSLALIKECETLRKAGLQVWETMDAGPQVKMVCLLDQSTTLLERLKQNFPHIEFLLTQVGEGPKIVC